LLLLLLLINSSLRQGLPASGLPRCSRDGGVSSHRLRTSALGHQRSFRPILAQWPL